MSWRCPFCEKPQHACVCDMSSLEGRAESVLGRPVAQHPDDFVATTGRAPVQRLPGDVFGSVKRRYETPTPDHPMCKLPKCECNSRTDTLCQFCTYTKQLERKVNRCTTCDCDKDFFGCFCHLLTEQVDPWDAFKPGRDIA